MSATQIRSITAQEVYSVRMKAAVMVTVITENGAVGKAVCSPGISVGLHEELPLYDGGKRFAGCGVRKAVRNVNEILGPMLIGRCAERQAENDAIILSKGKIEMGVNAITALSTAVLNAGANALGEPLYRHIGGVRAFTMPVPAALIATGSNRYGFETGIGYKPTYSMLAYGFDSYNEAVTALWETYMNWYDIMKTKLAIKMQPIAGMAIPKGKLRNDYELWEMMAEVIASSGYRGRIGLQVDMAANSFYNEETQKYEGIFSPEPKTRDEMIQLVLKMAREYPFVSIEDPLMEDDFEGFAVLTKESGIQIVGDDLIATHKDRLEKAIKIKACNCIRIATAQIGTFSEAAETALIAAENNIGISPCGERGEGLNACDYAVGLNAGTAREYGMCYSGNRLMEIEKEIGSRVRFYGREGIKGKKMLN